MEVVINIPHGTRNFRKISLGYKVKKSLKIANFLQFHQFFTIQSISVTNEPKEKNMSAAFAKPFV